jgi:hypothetical protein
MFAIHSPQTVELRVDEADEPTARINFSYNGADTSKCKMEIVSKDRVWTLIFNQRGYIVSQSFANADENTADKPELTAGDYIVNGVDTRSFSPYTHVAPVDADTLYRDGVTPGYKQPQSKEQREQSKAAIEAAHGKAQKAIAALHERMDEKPEDTVERERKEREEKFKQVSESLAHPPAAPLASSAPYGQPLRNPDGSAVNQQPQRDDRDNPNTSTGYDPLVPAPSSPMPGSAPPSRVPAPHPDVVNTTQSVR